MRRLNLSLQSTALKLSKNRLADSSQFSRRLSASWLRKYCMTSSSVGGGDGGSLDTFGFRLPAFFSSSANNDFSCWGCPAQSPLGDLFVLVLVLLYAGVLTGVFAVVFTVALTGVLTVFLTVFFTSKKFPQGKNQQPSSVFSGKQYIGALSLFLPFLNSIKPRPPSLSLIARKVFSFIAISATARELERENGFCHPNLLHISKSLKYTQASEGRKSFISTSCQKRLIISM